MKKSKTASQYRPIRPASGMSPEMIEELKMLKSLETRASVEQ